MMNRFHRLMAVLLAQTLIAEPLFPAGLPAVSHGGHRSTVAVFDRTLFETEALGFSNAEARPSNPAAPAAAIVFQKAGELKKNLDPKKIRKQVREDALADLEDDIEQLRRKIHAMSFEIAHWHDIALHDKKKAVRKRAEQEENSLKKARRKERMILTKLRAELKELQINPSRVRTPINVLKRRPLLVKRRSPLEIIQGRAALRRELLKGPQTTDDLVAHTGLEAGIVRNELKKPEFDDLRQNWIRQQPSTAASGSSAGMATGGWVGQYFAGVYEWLIRWGLPLPLIQLVVAPILETLVFQGVFMNLGLYFGQSSGDMVDAGVFFAISIALVYGSELTHPKVYKGRNPFAVTTEFSDTWQLVGKGFLENGLFSVFALHFGSVEGLLITALFHSIATWQARRRGTVIGTATGIRPEDYTVPPSKQRVIAIFVQRLVQGVDRGIELIQDRLADSVVFSWRNPEKLYPTGLLLRAMPATTEDLFRSIRLIGLRSKMESGMKDFSEDDFPDKVALSLTWDRGFSSTSLDFYGPLRHPNNVAFIVDPAYVRAHPLEFDLVGEGFVKGRKWSPFALGLEFLNLAQNEPHVDLITYDDEIHARRVPSEAISGLLVHPQKLLEVLRWQQRLNQEYGVPELPLYLLDLKFSKRPLSPYKAINAPAPVRGIKATREAA